MTVTYDQKRAAIEREIKMRKRVYPRWVEQDRMSQAKADEEIAAMEAVLADYPPRQESLL
jgi:hypothetical protein